WRRGNSGSSWSAARLFAACETVFLRTGEKWIGRTIRSRHGRGTVGQCAGSAVFVSHHGHGAHGRFGLYVGNESTRRNLGSEELVCDGRLVIPKCVRRESNDFD